MIVHERSYQSCGISSLIHRARLRKVVDVMRSVIRPETRTIADFGCSNGFLFSVLQQYIPRVQSIRLFGYDHSRELLEAAMSKNLENATFDYVDLNARLRSPNRQFDVVTCFETLEHVGNLRNALENLLASCKSRGAVVLSVPNEIGIPGLIKYLGRKAARRNPYGAFFENKSEFRYFWYLITGQSIATFRTADVDGWGPHLGFDWRTVQGYLEKSSACHIIATHNLFFGIIFVARKV